MPQDKTTLQKDVKLETKDTKEEPIKTKDKDTSSKIEIQHQTVQQESSTKLLIDIAKKIEDLEKRLDEISRGIPNRTFNRGRGRGRGATGPSTKTPQGNRAKAPEKKDSQNPLNRLQSSSQGRWDTVAIIRALIVADWNK